MTPNDIYLSVITKLNKNLGTDNITVDKPRFVIAFNENQIRRVSLLLERKNDDSLREIQKLLVQNKQLTKVQTLDDRVVFKLPDDYFELSSSYVKSSKGTCKDKKLFLWEIKDPNYNEVLSNSHLKPSFEYEEVPYIVSENNLVVFKDSTFDINNTFLSYYKYPTKIDIEGYIKTDNTVSSNINPELDERFINKVIAMTVEDLQRNTQDQLGFQLSKDRIVNNN